MTKEAQDKPEMKILLPKVDVIFKLLFGDKRNKEILIDFLQSVLKLPDEEYKQIRGYTFTKEGNQTKGGNLGIDRIEEAR